MTYLSFIKHNSIIISTIVICVLLVLYILKGLIVKRNSLFKKISKFILILVCIMAISIAIDAWHDKTIPLDHHNAIHMENIDGQEVNIAALSQKRPVILYFWGSWCNSCRLLTPSVEWLSYYYPTVGVAKMSGDNEAMRRYLDDHYFHFWIVNDTNNHLSQRWHVKDAPTTLIIYRNKVRFVSKGILTPIGLWARVWLAKQQK
ncbi:MULTISPECIES: thioredoxin-like domain-containing protein [Vibrio]|uniref:Redoxin domain-containing protein n=2 Tax=Vibrio TaxID=662 RepID=A0A7X4LP20_9VIBR|nr:MULTISPECIES: thioredoxin-like domain-containing protein [Vibrio]MBF9001016.1 redoxin domain-containing protein [Vibrio nitrifigilis]MZI95489.1 redoxin domain-containing protein [Vibrio eleionomae]